MAFTAAIKTNDHEDMLLKAYFQNTYPTAFGGTHTPSSRTIYVGLTTADAGVGGTQLTSECQGSAGTNGYARAGAVANSTNWPVASQQASNGAQLTFGTLTGGATAQTLTHASIGSANLSPGVLHYRAALQSSYAADVGSSPVIDAGDLIVSEL